ncbi:hypothetical protein OHB12_09090 [Nocardia sp. NBC_01730]|uniref:hypothetical protein n=1 Tax=Nocardia sp. NBC_01730 TaxID=2975998 RepID=UPI002E129912|nr:hypothetical protein OHB12_09090 [Nocardia sp. NBC_01730]
MSSAKRFQRAAVPVAATAVVLAGLLSACGGDKGGQPEPAAAPASQVASQVASSTTTTAVLAPAAGQAPAVAKTQGWLKIYGGAAPAGTANAVQFNVTSNPSVGQYVSDGSGRSLYRFDKDTAKPSVSNCAGQCAVTWPPLTVARDQSVYASGVDPQLVGFIERADGTCQITIGGWPVYYFSKDQKPGDLLGQGVGGTWFAVAPNGGKALSK